MKKFYLPLLFLICISCEEVVDIDLDESPPRLVIEASLVWDMEQSKNVQEIKLTTTAPYFGNEIPPAIGGSVSVFDKNGKEFVFEEVRDGFFVNEEIEPSDEETFELQVEYQGELYTATESFVTAPKIDYILQEDNGGFTGQDVELRVFYTDPEEQENYYLFKFYHEDNSLQVTNDQFTNGNQTFTVFSNEDLEAGDEVGIELEGISEGFYEYLFLLTSQAGSGGGPFQTQPTTVRGNIVNTSNAENFAFGYFRLSGRTFAQYKIE